MTPRTQKALLAITSTALSLGLAWTIWSSRRTPAVTPNQTIRVDLDAPEETRIPGRPPYVVDPVVGLRMPRSTTVTIKMMALNSDSFQSLERRSNNLGFVRSDDLTGELSAPRILVLGDSHTLGVVATEDNVGPVLEDLIRAKPGFDEALVLNAGCGYYSLYQHVLRTRTLIDTIQPQHVVVVVFAGNDFVELENQREPHLDDNLIERRPNPNPPPEQTSNRRKSLNLPTVEKFRFYMTAIFWQGLNQAAFLARNPDRSQLVRAKAERCVELMRQLADEHNFDVTWVLLPSADIVFPDLIAPTSPAVQALTTGGHQLELYNWFDTMLTTRGETSIRLLEPFQSDGGFDLYAADFHIWIRGHRIIANLVLPNILQSLADYRNKR